MTGNQKKHYTKPDDYKMQIEQVGKQFFLDKWAGDGWKNIAVFPSYDTALHARVRAAEIGRNMK